MKITRVTAIPLSFRLPEGKTVRLGVGATTKRDAIIVRVETDEGLTGYGEAHPGRSPGAVVSLINSTLNPMITGMDACDVVGVFARVNRMQLSSHGLGAGAALAVSGIDMALWDIRGKAAGMPLYRLLGGSDSVRARVLYLIWREPWMTLSRDTYISRTLAAFGWQTWASPRPQRYPELALEECRGAIDRVLLSSEPYAFRERHVAEVERALPGVPVDLIDGEMVSWYGSRAIEGLHYLAQFTRERHH